MKTAFGLLSYEEVRDNMYVPQVKICLLPSFLKTMISTLNVKKTHHFFRATITKIHCIKINNIWTQISYSSPHEAHLKNLQFCFCQKGEKFDENAKGHFS